MVKRCILLAACWTTLLLSGGMLLGSIHLWMQIRGLKAQIVNLPCIFHYTNEFTMEIEVKTRSCYGAYLLLRSQSDNHDDLPLEVLDGLKCIVTLSPLISGRAFKQEFDSATNKLRSIMPYPLVGKGSGIVLNLEVARPLQGQYRLDIFVLDGASGLSSVEYSAELIHNLDLMPLQLRFRVLAAISLFCVGLSLAHKIKRMRGRDHVNI